jgi:hypothetical protein
MAPRTSFVSYPFHPFHEICQIHKVQKQTVENRGFSRNDYFCSQVKSRYLTKQGGICEKKEAFLKNECIYKILSPFLHSCHFLGDTRRYLQLIFQIWKYMNFLVLVILFEHILRGYGEVFWKKEIVFSQQQYHIQNPPSVFTGVMVWAIQANIYISFFIFENTWIFLF